MNGERYALQYSIIRVVPDPVRDEPVNVGVLIHDPSGGAVGVRVLHDLGRIRTYTGEDVDLSAVGLALDALEGMSEEPQRRTGFLDELGRQYTKLIQLSPASGTLASSLEAELDALYERFVSLERRGRHGPQIAMTRRRLFSKVKYALEQREVRFDARRRLDGLLSSFVFDFVVERKAYRSLHCLSLSGELDQATDDAKALAYSVRDIRNRGQRHSDRMTAELDVTTLLAPPLDENEATQSVRAILTDVGHVRDPVADFDRAVSAFAES